MNRIALAQITSATAKSDNLKLARALIAEAKDRGACAVAFPEFLMAFSPVTQSAAELAALAEPLTGPFVLSLGEAAKRHRINVLATIYESCDIRDRVYDTALWLDASGKPAAVYRKTHLYDALGFTESAKFAAGNDIITPLAADFGRCGIMICYDLRFPEVSRILSAMGADILFAPSGWVQGEMKIEHWETMVRARAVENGCYVIAPDQTGNIYIGHSMAVDPFGVVLAEMGDENALTLIDIDRQRVAAIREKLPLLANRRPDLYSKYPAKKTV